MRNPRAKSCAVACGGTAAIEFALVAPIFLGLVFGTIEFGRLLWTKQVLQQTAIAGARCMAIAQGQIQNSSCASSGSYSSTSTTAYIQSVASGWGLSVPTSNITLNNAATCGGESGFSEVQITSTFNTPVPQLVQLAAGGTTLTASACYPNNPF
jgi:Flp pilus assembly protein TadG